MGLTDIVGQNGTGHGALADHFHALFQRVTADQVDVLTHGASGSGDGSGSAQSHVVAAAKDDLNHGIVRLGKGVGADALGVGTGSVGEIKDLHGGRNTEYVQNLKGIFEEVQIIVGVEVEKREDRDHAVAVDVAVVVKVTDDLCLEGAGL